MKLSRFLFSVGALLGAIFFVLHSQLNVVHAGNIPLGGPGLGAGLGAGSGSGSGGSSQVTIADGTGSQGPIFLTDFPTTGSSNRTTSLTYTVGSSLSGCIRPAIMVPNGSGISLTTNQAGSGATDLPLASGSAVTETFTITLSDSAVLQDMAGINVLVTCGSSYTNSISILIGRTPGLLLTVNNSTNDVVDSVTVPSTGTITRSYVLGYQRQGIATGCVRYAINPAASPNGTGITANLTTDESVDTVPQELLTLTFAPGALQTSYLLPITATCLSNGVNITPVYRRLIELTNGIPLSIAMVNPDGSFTSGSTTVTIPATGTYTGTFPLRYAKGAGALSCNRLAIPAPPAGVTVSSTNLTNDAVMLEPRDITDVTEEDVTVSVTTPNTPLSYSLPVTIECSNTVPRYQTFNVNIVRQQAPKTTSISFSYNGDVSQNGSLSDTDLLNLPVTGATSRSLQLNWTVPVGSTGCVIYREDIDTPAGLANLGNGPGATPSSYQLTSDPYSYTGKSVSKSGIDQNFTINVAASDLTPGKPFTVQYAVWCNGGLYDSSKIILSRFTNQAVVTTQICVLGRDPIPTPTPTVPTVTPTATPTSTPTPTPTITPVSPTPTVTDTPTPTPTPTATPSGKPTPTPTQIPLGDIIPPSSSHPVYTFDDVFGASQGFALAPTPTPTEVDNSPGTYSPPVSPIANPTLPVITSNPVIISTTPCGTTGGGNPPPPTPTPSVSVSPGGPSPTPVGNQPGTWDYSQSSRRL